MVFCAAPRRRNAGGWGIDPTGAGNGGQVRVVFVTNGDGYVDGVRREVQRCEPRKMTSFSTGNGRQTRKALQAVDAIGRHDGQRFVPGVSRRR